MSGLLLDTQLLVWAGYAPQRLAPSLVAELVDQTREISFSVVSIWEVAIKASLGRDDFQVNPPALRLGLLEQGFRELPIQVDHVLAVQHLPRIHRDPHRCAEDCVFVRLLVAQAAREKLSLLTTDRTLLGYGDGVRWVG
jgi:PIN domain nuclease of toxin-antitoxin system